MYGYIYETTNLVNGKKYIGKRVKSYFQGTNYLGSGRHLRNAVHKYGKENFSVELLEKCYSNEELNRREYEIIEERNAVDSPNYYNLINGGQNGLSGFHHSEESKRISSLSNRNQKRSEIVKLHMSQNHADVRGTNNPFYGKSHSDETRKKISDTLQGHYKGYVWYNNSITHGKYLEGTQPEGWVRGKLPLSSQTRKRMSKVHSGRIWVNNSEVETLINPNDFDEYVSQGYTKGRLKRT